MTGAERSPIDTPRGRVAYCFEELLEIGRFGGKIEMARSMGLTKQGIQPHFKGLSFPRDDVLSWLYDQGIDINWIIGGGDVAGMWRDPQAAIAIESKIDRDAWREEAVVVSEMLERMKRRADGV